MDEKRKFDPELGKFLQDCFFKSKLTITDICIALEKGPRTIEYWFKGERKPSQKALLSYLKLTKVSYEEIPF